MGALQQALFPHDAPEDVPLALFNDTLRYLGGSAHAPAALEYKVDALKRALDRQVQKHAWPQLVVLDTAPRNASNA